MKPHSIFVALSILLLPLHVLAREPGALGKQPTQRVSTNMGIGCQIAVTLPISTNGGVGNGGKPSAGVGGLEIAPLPKAWRSKSFQRLYFHLICLDADEVADGGDTVSFDPKIGAWKKDVAKRMKRAFGFEMSAQEYQDTYEDQDKAIRIYNVRAVNAKGYASTIDDTIGDEKTRARRMSFCLINRPKALCGYGLVGYVANGPKNDLTERALDIVRSIEFLDDEAPSTEP